MIIPSPTAKKRVRIEIIPLIDIIFFLLATFLMLSLSMVKNQGITVNLPTASTSTEQDKSKQITITIDKQGQVYLDKDLVSDQSMRLQLKALKASDPDLKVLINGDEHATFGQAVNVLDEIRQLGIVHVAIRTKSAHSGESR